MTQLEKSSVFPALFAIIIISIAQS